MALERNESEEWRAKQAARLAWHQRQLTYSQVDGILVAWLTGELTEGAAARLMCTDIIGLRTMRDELIEVGKRAWDEYNRENPLLKETEA